jgi:hypothetical protein
MVTHENPADAAQTESNRRLFLTNVYELRVKTGCIGTGAFSAHDK